MRLLTYLRLAYCRLVPPEPDPKDLSAEDVDQILAQGIEDLTGKPTNHGSAQANIAALQRRLAWLEREAAIMADTAANNPAADLEGCAQELAQLRREKSAVQQQLADLELQLRQQN